MCRCEAILYVQKLRDLEGGGADVQIPQELARDSSLRIGVRRAMDSHPGATVLDNYSQVKEKRMEQWLLVESEEGETTSPACGGRSLKVNAEGIYPGRHCPFVAPLLRVNPDKEVGTQKARILSDRVGICEVGW
jgi:hypothetical protein